MSQQHGPTYAAAVTPQMFAFAEMVFEEPDEQERGSAKFVRK
jgi:hypothetical protein